MNDQNILQQGRNNALVLKNIKPIFFSGSANHKLEHYFCPAVRH
jgi:hypothetical protein